MPYTGKNHEDCRKTVWLLCSRKCERELTIIMIERVHKLEKKDLDFNNEKVPRGFCDNC